MKTLRHKKKTINWQLVFLIVFIVIISALIDLFIVSSGGIVWWHVNTKVWGEFGAFIGGILLAATLLYQVRAFRKQQIESKFFEMVKYYRDNIAEMRIKNPFHYVNAAENKVEEEYIIGRRVIETIFEQYKVGIKIARILSFKNDNSEELRNLFDKINKNLKKCKWESEIIFDDWQKRLNINRIAYLITFWGIPLDEDAELKGYLTPILEEDQITKLINAIKKVVAVVFFCNNKTGNSIYYKNLKYSKRGIFDELKETDIYDTKQKLFSGNQHLLGHYFRHLFQTVKYIDQQKWWVLSQKEKYEYIKTLRAQMSNYEQALFFINSLTQLGRKWEFENPDGKELISTYNLIKNLPQHFIPNMEPQFYYPNIDYDWKENYQPKKITAMKKNSTIKMGNDEFILYIRKNNPTCNIDNKTLGKKIWEWISSNDFNAKETFPDMQCLWGDNTPNTNPEILPKTATQFELRRNLLPALYDFLDTF